MDASVRGTTLPARLLADDMVRQGSGDKILTASPVDMLPGFDAAVCSATSAFLRAFAETLQDELSQSGVKATALMPELIGPSGGRFTDLLGALMRRAPAGDPAGRRTR